MSNKIIIVGDKSMAEVPEDLSAAFKSLGYESSFCYFYYSKFAHKIAWGFVNTPFKFSKKIGDMTMHSIMADINRRFVEEMLSKKPNIIIVINGFSISASSLVELKKNNIKVINWVLDDPSKASFSYFIEASSIYDKIFCCSKNWLQYVKIWNKNILYLPCAVDPEKYKKTDVHNSEPKYGISFVGTFVDNDSSSFFRFYLLNFLSKFNYKIRIAGKNAIKYLKEKNKAFIVSDQLSLSEVLNIYKNSKNCF